MPERGRLDAPTVKTNILLACVLHWVCLFPPGQRQQEGWSPGNTGPRRGAAVSQCKDRSASLVCTMAVPNTNKS